MAAADSVGSDEDQTFSFEGGGANYFFIGKGFFKRVA